MEFAPINGQKICQYASLRLGWCTLKTNGCGVLAIYNALGLLGKTVPIQKILQFFHAWYRPHWFGITPRRIGAFLRKENVPFRVLSVKEAEAVLKNGDIAIMTYWCRCFWGRFVDPFGGAHTVCVRYDGTFKVYNRFSNREKVYSFDRMEEILRSRRLIKLYCLQKTVENRSEL